MALTLGAAAAEPRPVRILLLARTRPGWWDELRHANATDEQLAVSYTSRAGYADATGEAALDYAAAITAAGFSHPAQGLSPRFESTDAIQVPGELQAAVLAGLLGPDGRAYEALSEHELGHLHGSVIEYGLALPAHTVRDAVATALLCGAVNEASALAALGHIPALQEPELRLNVARWLREVYPPVSRAYWAEALPDPLAEQMVSDAASPEFLVGMFMEATEDQDRRALTVLARAAPTHPALRGVLAELLTVLPGISPATVDAALRGGYPAPLADALISLARNIALPAELLDAVPVGTTVLGEFPVLLASSLVEAYEHRLKSHRPSAQRGLTMMLTELAERLADLGRAQESLASARRAVEAAQQLPDRPDCLERATTAMRRAHEIVQPSAPISEES